MPFFLQVKIDDQKGRKQIFNFHEIFQPRQVGFTYVDDIRYVCDIAEIGFVQPYGIITEGATSTTPGKSIPPLIGTEKVTLTFGEDIEKDKGKIQVDMDIFKIVEKPGSPASQFFITRILLVNSKIMPFLKPEKNRSFQGKQSAFAKKVAKESGFSKEKLIVEDTEGSKTIKQLYWTDGVLMKDMSESAVGSQNRSAPFIWHISRDEFHFHSYEYPMRGERHTLSKIYGMPQPEKSKKPADIEEARRSEALDWVVTTRPKLSMSSESAGMAAGGSSFESGYVMKQKSGQEVYKEGTQLERRMPADDTDYDSMTRYVYTGGDADDLDGYLKNTIARKQKESVELKVLVRGKAERMPCKIANFEYQNLTNVGKESKYSGKYFVKRVTHEYIKGEYYNNLTLVRGGYDLE